jgi:hypothetical protein
MVKKKLKLLRAWAADNWKLSVVIVAVIVALALLLTFKLGSFAGGLSGSEANLKTQVATDSFGASNIIREPLFLPYKGLLYLLQYTPFTGPTGIRSISALFGLLGVLAMFYIFKKWYTLRIAVLGSVLYATTSWFLHTSRYADQASAYLLVPLLAAAMIALQAKARSRLAMAAVLVFGLSALYIPGVILFLLPALIIKRKVIFRALRLQPLWYEILVGIIGLLLLSPLVVMLVKPLQGSSALSNLSQLVGLPGSDFHSVKDMLFTLKDRLSDIFAYNTAGPIFAPGHVPWFDICTTVLVVVGMVQFVRYWRLDRSKLIALTAVLSLLLIALGGPVSSVILLPFLFLFAVEGLKWLLEIWLEIFPRNPFARGFAVSMICILTFSVAFYQVNKYFFAWAKAPETRQVFNHHP